ncbi:MAG TPA: FG-GAP-like repeat-containing protein [Balneolales bacterium]|nr:FG-GAP-like repeat-containing protein [Balneolales bacterium]
MKRQSTHLLSFVTVGGFRYIILMLLFLVLPTCKKGSNPVSPTNSGTVKDVNTYLSKLPAWSVFSPPMDSTAPTPTGQATTEQPDTMNVDMIDSSGTVYTEKDVVYGCQVQPYTLTSTPEKLAMYSPDREIVWAGALIQGKSYASGLGSLLPLVINQRSPIQVSIPSLANNDNARTVQDPTQANVDQAIGSMIGNATQSGLATPSTIIFRMSTYYSEQQAALQMGLSGRYLGFQASASGSIDQTVAEHTVTAEFYQKMYTVVIQAPQTPGGFFSSDFTNDKLQEQISLGRIGPDNLPVYVSNIVYGRMMMFSLTSTASVSDIRATMQAGYKSIGGSVSGSLKAKQKAILQNAKIAVTSIGGDADATIKMIRSGDWSQYFTDNAPLSSAAPLSYTFRNLGDNSIAKVSETTSYNVRTCTARQATPGTFDLKTAQDLGMPIPTPVTIHLADVSGDGKKDLIWNHLGTTNDIAIALSNGDGTFAAPQVVTNTLSAPEGWGKYKLLTGDFNGDGKADLLWNYDGVQNRTFVALSTGGGSFKFLPAQVHPASNWGEHYTRLIGDLNGDGYDDIVWNYPGTSNRTYVGFSNGDGTFDMPSAYQDQPNNGWGGYSVHLGDVNSDGKMDIIWNELSASNNITYVGLFNSTTPSKYFTFLSSQARNQTGWDPYIMLTGNVDGNNGMDLVFTKSEDPGHNGPIPIHRNISSGNGQFTFPGVQFTAIEKNNGTDVVRMGDVNGDGRDDIIYYNPKTDSTYVGLGSADGTFDFSRLPQGRPQIVDDWSQFHVLVGDITGDKRADILWNDGSARNRVYVGIARANSQ